ncbi:hypothetical protein, partial [Pseudomonas prosekii]|uniref:hypothetical protein n=1 Tax=Pseudomonas prosekii TaxID=1148509 RepID=UPI001C63A0E2
NDQHPFQSCSVRRFQLFKSLKTEPNSGFEKQAVCSLSPSPLWGEGWGEGLDPTINTHFSPAQFVAFNSSSP